MILLEEFPGVCDRIRMAMLERGFWNPKRNAPAVAKFVRAFPAGHYDDRVVALWVHERIRRRPSLSRLTELARDLECSVTYLLLGDAPFEPREWTRLVARQEAYRAKESGHVQPPAREKRERERERERAKPAPATHKTPALIARRAVRHAAAAVIARGRPRQKASA